MTISPKILSEKETIWLDENGFIRIKPNDGFEFNESDVQRQFESYGKLGINTHNKAKLLVDATYDFQMNKEARDIAAKKAKEYFIATAIVSNSFATRLLVNFLNSFYNFGLPIKMFSTENEAINWLKKKT